ncbi:MAG: hypothetical protein DI637_08135 [Citromicrobium sp.]|nr:MAG: hypothetical protein DI637_08135 [Citromicrobium sp.]
MAIVAGRPTLFVIAGPNGAGKSTFYDTVLAGRVDAPFINPDIIQREEIGDPSMQASYAAAKLAETRRRGFLASGQSFVMETVFSHPSKLELLRDARAAGYRIVVFHLMLASPDIAVARVEGRVEEGGHPVPEDKVRSRFARNAALIRQAALMADRAQVFDASALNERPRLLLELSNGNIMRQAESWPNWFADTYR